MQVSAEVLASYQEGKDAGAQALLASKDPKVLRVIAARGMRIAAMHGEALTLSPARDLDHTLDVATKRANRLSGAALVSTAAKAAKHFAHRKDHKPATAALLTKALKSDDALATRYALDKSVTGGLVKLRMRVRRDRFQGPNRSATGPRAAHDVIAARMIDARRQAALDVERAINEAEFAPNARERVKLIAKVRAILHTWASDPAVLQAARSCGWRC